MNKAINYICLVALLSAKTIFCQKSYGIKYNKPWHEFVKQSASSGKNPGTYHQVVNADITTLAPGDKFMIDYYITGYGFIDFTSTKLYYSSSASIIDLEKSYITADFKVKDSLIYYGGLEIPIEDSGIVALNGMLFDTISGITHTYFDDFVHAVEDERFLPVKSDYRPDFSQYVQEQTIIFSEATLGKEGVENFNPPIRYNLKLKEDVPPGDYYYTFVLSYFNGDKWNNNHTEIKLEVLPWYERHASLIKYFSLVIGILTIITLVSQVYKIINSTIQKYRKRSEFGTVKSEDSMSKTNGQSARMQPNNSTQSDVTKPSINKKKKNKKRRKRR